MESAWDGTCVCDVIHAQERLNEALEQDFEMAVVDQRLPWSTGLSVGESLRTLQPEAVLVMWTASGDERLAVAALKSGFDDYLPRDMGADKVVEALREGLAQNSRLRRARFIEGRLERLLDRLRVGVFRATPGGRILEANAAMRRILGIPPESDLDAYHLSDVVREHAQLVEQLVEPFESDGTVLLEDMPLQGFDGRKLRALVNLARVRVNGRVLVDGLVEDITRRRATEDALRESDERYTLAAVAGNDGIWDWNLRTGELYLSPRWLAMLGCEESTGRPEDWFERVHPEDRASLEKQLSAHILGDTPVLECEYRMLHGDGSWRWMVCRGMALRGEERATRLAGSQTDITQRKEYEERLLHGALYDQLTGLPNRALLLDRIEHAIGVRQRHPEFRFAVAMLDLDRFKLLNEGLGHGAGDRLLVEVARRLEACMRPADTLARLGGDEFAILLEEIDDADEALYTARQLHGSLKKHILIDEHDVVTTASIGIVLYDGEQSRPTELLRDADTAMHQAKSTGPGRSEVFAHGMHQKVLDRMRLEMDLHRALKRDELILHYQPIIDLKDGTITGCEALLRWNHPTRGLLSPAHFIPLAEETGLILPIGHWILRQASEQALQWAHKLGEPISVSVNLSSQQFRQPELIALLKEILHTTGLGPDVIKLELTESTLLEDAESTHSVLDQLRELDIKLLIDDFGTGYSSLSYLQNLESESIKIDRSFISAISELGENTEIVKTIVELARSLGMGVIAEGVESASQLQALRDFQCQFAQGFFFSKPLPVPAFDLLLGRNPRW